MEQRHRTRRKGGKVATGINPAGTKARILPGFALGRPPPPGDPGWGKLLGVRPGAGFAAISIPTVARTVPTILSGGVSKPGGVLLVLKNENLFSL